jgi:hypothetical protein
MAGTNGAAASVWATACHRRADTRSPLTPRLRRKVPVARWNVASACWEHPSARLELPSVRRNGWWSASERSRRAVKCSQRALGSSRGAAEMISDPPRNVPCAGGEVSDAPRKESNAPQNRPDGWRRASTSPTRSDRRGGKTGQAVLDSPMRAVLVYVS